MNLRASAIRHRRDLCARRYTETENNVIGLVHLTDAATAPRAAGTLPCSGEPRAVAFYNDDLLLAAILTSDDYVRTSGVLRVLRCSLFPDAYSYSYSQDYVVHTVELGGQPDWIAVSPDKQYVVVAVENERDPYLEDDCQGYCPPPQMPGGYVVVFNSSAADPAAWTNRTVNITGLDDCLYGSDPEPEFVAINEDNIAVVTRTTV